MILQRNLHQSELWQVNLNISCALSSAIVDQTAKMLTHFYQMELQMYNNYFYDFVFFFQKICV